MLGTEVYRDAPGMVSMAGLPERHAPGRAVAVEGDIEARLGASSIAGSTDAYDRRCHPAAPDHARRPPRRGRAATRPHHLHRAAARRRDHPRRPRHRRHPRGRAVARLDHLLLAAGARPLGVAPAWPPFSGLGGRGRWGWLAVGRALLGVLHELFAPPVWHVVIDDTVVERISTGAPGSLIHHNHAAKPNRSRFLRGQGWLCLAAVVERGWRVGAGPPVLRPGPRGDPRGTPGGAPLPPRPPRQPPRPGRARPPPRGSPG